MSIEISPFERKVYELIVQVGEMVPLEEKHEVLIAILINTTEKLEAFQKWIEEYMDGDELTVDEIDIMNEVSRIDRAYGSAVLEEEE